MSGLLATLVVFGGATAVVLSVAISFSLLCERKRWHAAIFDGWAALGTALVALTVASLEKGQAGSIADWILLLGGSIYTLFSWTVFLGSMRRPIG